MKRIFAIILAVVMLISVIPFAAFAQNGPSQESFNDGYGDIYLAWIRGQEPDKEGNYGEYADIFEFFSGNTAHDDVYPGIRYNRTTNTLTLNEVNAPYLRLFTNVMGDDFKIEVTGTCALGQITVWGDGYGGNVTFTGTGTLSVNASENFEYAVLMNAESTPGQVTFGKNVHINLFGTKGAVQTCGSTLNDPTKLYICENGQATGNILSEVTTYEQNETVDGIYCYNEDTNERGGWLADCASDPTGVYAVQTGYRDDPNQTLYWVSKYVYLEKFDAYIKDYNYFENDPKNHYGELEFTQEEWEAQSEYTLRSVPSEEPALVHFRKVEDLDEPGDWTWTEYKLKRASDPTGLYGYSTFTEESGGVTREGVHIHHFIYDNGTKRNVLDPAFKEIELYKEEFESSEWTVVYGTDNIDLEWQGNYSALAWLEVYQDADGNKYAKDWDDTCYTFREDEGIVFNGNFHHYLVKAEGVDIKALTPCVKTVTIPDAINYILPAPFAYSGSAATPHTHAYKAQVVKPGAYTVGYTVHTCACGDSYVDTYTNPTGKIAGFKCKARTANAVALTWNKPAASNISGYQVQISNAAGSAWATAKATTANAYTFKGLTAGANYKFRIRFYIKAADGKNHFSPWVAIASPTLPTGTTVTKLTPAKKAFTAQWKKQTVTGYQLQYGLKANFAGAKTLTVKNAKTLKATVSKLAAGKVYYVRIRTYKTIAKANYFSAWSKVYKVKTK